MAGGREGIARGTLAGLQDGSISDHFDTLAREIGARIILGRNRPALLAPSESPRPEHQGRCGLLILLTDGTTREVTYEATASREKALGWLLQSAGRTRGGVAAVCDWSDSELAAQARRDRLAADRAEQSRRELERLLDT